MLKLQCFFFFKCSSLPGDDDRLLLELLKEDDRLCLVFPALVLRFLLFCSDELEDDLLDERVCFFPLTGDLQIRGLH